MDPKTHNPKLQTVNPKPKGLWAIRLTGPVSGFQVIIGCRPGFTTFIS